MRKTLVQPYSKVLNVNRRGNLKCDSAVPPIEIRRFPKVVICQACSMEIDLNPNTSQEKRRRIPKRWSAKYTASEIGRISFQMNNPQVRAYWPGQVRLGIVW